MRRFRQSYRALLVLLMFGAGLTAVGVLFPLFDRFAPKRASVLRDRIQVAWYRGLLRVLSVRVRRSGSAAQHPAALWVSNHVSWLDIVVLGAQRPLTFVSKSEVGSWPVVGVMARGIGTILVRRGDNGSTRRAAESMAWLLRQRRSVMLFPEGTSSDGRCVLRFHSRLFQPATLVGAPVQAIALAYREAAAPLIPFVGEDQFLPHLWRILAEPEISVDLVFCAGFAADLVSRDRLAQATRSAIVDALDLEECGAQLAPAVPARA